MKNKIIIAVTLLVSASLLQSCGFTNKKKSADPEVGSNMMQSMRSTMDKMDSIPMTGDFDLDFANMMIIHHQAAIDMSMEEAENGTDPWIKKMAQNIIVSQKTEIEHLQQFIENYEMPEADTLMAEKNNELSDAMTAMLDKMRGIETTGDTDKDFVLMMIPHHESAITMAEVELLNGTQPELKTMAENMAAVQKMEVNYFNAWLSNQE